MIYREMSENEQQHQQSADFPTAGYEASEEERGSLEEERRNTHVALPEKEQSPEPAEQQKRGERKGKRRPTTAIGAAAPGRQVTLFDLDKQLDRQRRLMERMADDVKHLRKQFNQVQRDLAKFEKRLGKTKTSPSAKRGRGRT
jgi:uncharacterized coiled-coil protein SlyX